MDKNEKEAQGNDHFSVIERRVACPHKFQLYVDYGTTKSGAWLRVGVNETEFGFGYLPKQAPLTAVKENPEAI